MEAFALFLGYGVLVILALVLLIVLVFVGLELYCRYHDKRDRDKFLIKSALQRHAMDYTSYLDNSSYSNSEKGYAAFIAHLNSHVE